MTKLEKLAEIMRFREQCALIALVRAQRSALKMSEKLQEQTALGMSKTDALNSYVQHKLEEIGRPDYPSSHLLSISVGHFRRKREVIAVELIRRKLLKQLRELEQRSSSLGKEWRAAHHKLVQIKNLAVSDLEAISEANELDAEEDLQELLTHRGQNERND